MPDKAADSVPVPKSSITDASGLAEALRQRVRGEVRFDPGSRAVYSTDGSNYRQVPIGVVLPHDTDDVLAAISTCREFDAPVLCRGGGTSLAGQCCNVAVVLDFSKYMARILEIDPVRRIARVQPGVVLDSLRNAAEKYHLTFAPDPASHDRCTIGGMIGNNSCGVHSVMAGKTDDNIEELEVVTYDGARLVVGQAYVGRAPSPASGPGSSGRSALRAHQIHAALKQIAETYSDLIRQKFPQIPRRVSGYNLNYLLPENGFHIARALVGSEGTCATVLEATCRLVESPPQRVLLVVAYPDIFQCADHIPEIMEHHPIGLEGFDDLLVYYTRTKGINPEGLALLPQGGGWLMVEFGGQTIQEAESQARGLVDALSRSPTPPNTRLFSGQQAKRIWEIREASLGVTSHVPGEPLNWEGWEDAAVAPEKLGGYLRDLRKLMAAFQYKGSLYGHFGHACVHTRLNFDLQSKDGIAKFRKFVEEAADLVVSYGGSLSGEHGDGQARAELLPKMFGPELMQAFRDFKSAWDPDWKMNPGKLIGLPEQTPNKLHENLRLGPNYAPWEPLTRFQFPADHGSLAAATLRCVGVGKCRREEEGVMCPSWRVTHDEEHSTRGRAHLLWEMTQGQAGQNPAREDAIIRDGWRSEAVKQSLDLCLACKGCKSDCPVGVDVATYKAEFLSHYYEGRVRPRSAYAFGNIDLWARAASHAPGLVNLTTQLPFVRDLAKLLAGMPHQRTIPTFAPETFKQWFHRTREIDQWSGGRLRPPSDAKRASVAAPATTASPWKSGPSGPRQGREENRALAPEVLLWPDTFNNYFQPATARAAVEVLEAAGYRVLLPQANLCCGRPLYDFGMLDRAQSLLLNILDELEPEIEAGIPIVGLEPSCVAVFRDELLNFFPHDHRAQALSKQTFLLSEFLERGLENNSRNAPLPQFPRKALLHGHCHHKSIMKMTAEESLLRRIGIDFQSPSPGCCGMAGSFGFERDKDKYDISQAIGELELLPAVRKAPADWLIIADGFSCREQIAQGTGRHALHLAEVLQMALDPPELIDAPYPESARVRQRDAEVRASMQRAGLGLGALAASALLLWQFARNRLPISNLWSGGRPRPPPDEVRAATRPSPIPLFLGQWNQSRRLFRAFRPSCNLDMDRELTTTMVSNLINDAASTSALAQPSAAAPLRGSVLVLIQFDVCEEIKLDELRKIFGARTAEASFKHQAPGYVRYQRPPVEETLDPLILDSGERLEGQIKYYDYGVVSLVFELPFSGDWDTLIQLSCRWTSDSNFEKLASRVVKQKLEHAAPALVKPYTGEWLQEDYFIFHVREIKLADMKPGNTDAAPSANDLLAAHGDQIAQVVRGEMSMLSEGERQEILQSRISYYPNDLAVIGWNAAFIYDTDAGAETAIQLLQYANSQLLEFRHYDELLTKELENVYDFLDAGGTGLWSRWRTARAASKLHTVLLDVNELTERADNAIKFLSDMFSARLYKLCAAKVGVPDYKDLVKEKLQTAEDLYRFMVEQFNQSRAFILELMVVVILIIELVYFFRGKPI